MRKKASNPGFFSNWRRPVLCFAAFAGFSSVAASALNAHLPQSMFIADGRAMMARSVDMQMWHALLLCALALHGGRAFRNISFGMMAGMLLFCLPVYSLALRGPNFAQAAPVGGSMIMLSWIALGVQAARFTSNATGATTALQTTGSPAPEENIPA